MTQEYRIFGPPGTGKTSRLATRDVPRAVDKYGVEKVLIASFTRAGAREIANKRSRETGMPINLPERSVGTMHSIAYHALNQPQITEVKFLKEWNENYPDFTMSGKSAMDAYTLKSHKNSYAGDTYLSALNIKRNQMDRKKIAWKPNLLRFEKLWTQFKIETKSMDFTDMIETCYLQMPTPPNEPKVMFIDEAQDSTKLQLSLARRWGQHMEWIVLVGDDDQTIYQFAGATPEAFLDPPVDEKFKTVLGQSYRVPQKVLEFSKKIIRNVKNREPKKYAPRKKLFSDNYEQGEVINQKLAHYRKPQELMATIEKELETKPIKNMPNLMILASCAYMLTPICKMLLNAGIPFHNPYRTHGSGRAWNPLLSGGRSRSTGVDILTAFLNKGIDDQYWNVPQFYEWAKHIKTGDNGWIHGRKTQGLKLIKQAIDNNEPGLHTIRDALTELLTPAAINRALDRDTRWFQENIVSSKEKSIQFPLIVYKKMGIDGIEENPKIVIGTIHSIKGSEAKTVILFPDLSFDAAREYAKSNTPFYDAIHRLFYVGATRAYQKLILCAPSSPNLTIFF